MESKSDENVNWKALLTTPRDENTPRKAVCPFHGSVGQSKSEDSKTGGGCPVGFGVKKPTVTHQQLVSNLPKMSIDVLRLHGKIKFEEKGTENKDAPGPGAGPEGHRKMPRLISLKGIIFMIGDEDQIFGMGEPLEPFVGHDISLAFAKKEASVDRLDASIESIDLDQHKRLESWWNSFLTKYTPIGALDGDGMKLILGNDFASLPSTSEAKDGNDGASSSGMGTDLHSYITQNNLDGLRSCLLEQALQAEMGGGGDGAKPAAGSAAIDAPDGRTGMSPLHRAIEGGNLSLVQLLLEHGANAALPCPALYDAMSSVELARKFGHGEIERALVEAGEK